jgi:dTDP-glucose 4,6-dehydratase
MITGGAGFIGSNFAKYMVKKYPEHEFIVYDKLTYAGNLDNLRDLKNKSNFKFVKGDVCDLNFLLHILKDVDVVFHLAAESHVCNSIGDSLEFTKSNTYGTHVLLEASRLSNIKKFIHVSTDEVYGDIEEGSFHEDDKLSPNNPYSASKAAAEMIVRSYYKTYKMPIIITRGNNVYGPFQYPEKIISRFICNLLQDKKIPIHGSGENIRTYIHTDDVSKALDTIFQKGVVGEIYNIGTSYEKTNLEIAKLLINKLEKDESLIEYVQDRPFNDKRYSVDIEKLKSLGWVPLIDFETGLNSTIQWYKENLIWWLKVTNKSNMQRFDTNHKIDL